MAKGKDLVERLVKALYCLPTCWEDIVGDELADEVKEYLGWEGDEDPDESDWEQED